MPRLRSSEWFLLIYFAYVALVSPFFISAWRPCLVAVAVAALVLRLARGKSWLRDWVPLPLTLAAFWEMDWFTPSVRDHHWEQTLIVWDRVLFDRYALSAAIESAGRLMPTFLELCYALVYLAAPVALWALIANGRRVRINQFWLAYLVGTLSAYALFPYFLSSSPRIAFPGENLPHIVTFFRRINLWIASRFDIHSSVFPSAHVSSALSAAWGLLETIPERSWIGWSMAVYGLCVAIATIYGRYHYAADAVAGIAISFLGLAAVKIADYRKSRGA